jgi:hypothetical protein
VVFFGLGCLALHVRDEIWVDEPTVKPHLFSDLDPVLDSPALLDGDDTLFPNFLQGLRNEATDVDIAVRRDCQSK